MKTSESINELAKAMSSAQKEMKPASKDGLNPHYKSRYVNITSVWDAIREPLTSNGLTVWQDVISEEKSVSVTTRIVHSSGQWVEFGPLSIPLFKFDAQAIGSGTSYAKRYALCAAIGVVSEEDDDGESTLTPAQKMQRSSPPPSPIIHHPTVTQCKELEAILKICPPDFVKLIHNEMSEMGCVHFFELPIEQYEKIKTAANKVKKAVH